MISGQHDEAVKYLQKYRFVKTKIGIPDIKVIIKNIYVTPPCCFKDVDYLLERVSMSWKL